MLTLVPIAVLMLQIWTTKPPEPPAVFVIAYDGSRSVPAGEFATYSDMMRAAVLELLRPNDTVVLTRMDQPQNHAETFSFGSRLSRFEADVVRLYQRLHELKQATGRHSTDIGLALDHLRRRIDLDRALPPTTPTRYLVVAATDGVIEGRQTIARAPSAPLESIDWRLVFLGVRPDVENSLRRLAGQNGFDDQERILVVPFSHWRQLAARIPVFLGRSPNPSLIRALSRVPGGDGDPRR